MEGKTHAAVGAMTGAVTLIISPISVSTSEIGVCLGASIVGALFPDLDVKNSKGNKMLDSALKVLAVAAAIAVVMSFAGRLNVIALARLNLNKTIGVLGYLLLALFTRTRPHREFSHSVTSLVLTGIASFAAFGPDIAIWHSIGYLSHIVIDLLNGKGESLFWPTPGKYCFSVCSASGIASKVMFYTSSGLCILLVLAKVGGFA